MADQHFGCPGATATLCPSLGTGLWLEGPGGDRGLCEGSSGQELLGTSGKCRFLPALLFSSVG